MKENDLNNRKSKVYKNYQLSINNTEKITITNKKRK